MGTTKTGSHLERHGERWRVCVRVPPSQQEALGKKWLKKSLPAGTTPRQAETLKWPAIAELKKQIAEASARQESLGDPITAEALRWREELRKEEAASGLVPHSPARQSEVGERLRPDQILEPVQHWPELEAAAERAGDLAKKDHAASQTFLAVAYGHATPIRAQLSQWYERKRFSEGYQLDVERALSRFEVWCDKNRVAGTIEAITPEIASRYVHRAFVQGGSHHKTANKDVSCLSSYWRYLAKSLGRRVNPWAEQRVEAPSERHGPRQDKKRPFTSAEVVKLLTGIRLERERRFSLIAALSGMREDEIASLTASDCRDGVFNVGRSKTAAGVRKVPIHSGLAHIVDQLSANKEDEAFLFDDLPNQKPGSKRGRGAPVAQAFTRERRRVGVDERAKGQRQSNVDFHSWRRWFIRTAIEAFEAGVGGFTPWTIARVVGHKVEKGEIDGVTLPLGMTMGRYPGESSESSLRACVEAVKLPDGVSG